jgi:hypothetical protein
MAKAASATTDYKRQQGLTIEQQSAIDLLLTGKTDRETADAVGVNRVTVTKWRLYDPWFRAALNRRRQETWGAAVDRLRSLLPVALDVLEDELQNGAEPGKTALAVLRLAGLDRQQPAVNLGSYLIGLTDAEEILDELARRRSPGSLENILHPPPTDRERVAALAELEARAATEG